jgi:hypothetical protein
VTPFPSEAFATPDEQQSRRIKTSLFAISRDLCIPLHITVGHFFFLFSGNLLEK